MWKQICSTKRLPRTSRWASNLNSSTCPLCRVVKDPCLFTSAMYYPTKIPYNLPAFILSEDICLFSVAEPSCCENKPFRSTAVEEYTWRVDTDNWHALSSIRLVNSYTQDCHWPPQEETHQVGPFYMVFAQWPSSLPDLATDVWRTLDGPGGVHVGEGLHFSPLVSSCILASSHLIITPQAIS